MPASRCSLCSVNWPITAEYRYCPACREATSVVQNSEAMDPAEANSLRLRHEFERFYESRELTQPPLEQRPTCSSA